MQGMKFVEWSYEHSLNVEELDRHHRDMMDVLNDAISHTGTAVDEKKFFRKKIGIAKKLMVIHFRAEEKMLRKSKCPTLHEHKAHHKLIMKEVMNISVEVENSKNDLNLFNVIAHLKELFLKHIKEYDKSAQEYFEKAAKKSTKVNK